MNDTQTRFIALEPDESLTSLIWQYKERTLQRVGPQLFLDHPPHLTAFLAVFPIEVSLLESLVPLARRFTPPRVQIRGWHVFTADALTGGNTLVCDIDAEDQHHLRTIQAAIVEAVSGLRDRDATEARFGPRLDSLNPDQQTNVANHGFPFLGEGWIPHFTVASIRSTDWDRLYAEFRDDPPSGEFTCPRLREYVLVDEHPISDGAINFSK